jgi:hypothetical protein
MAASLFCDGPTGSSDVAEAFQPWRHAENAVSLNTTNAKTCRAQETRDVALDAKTEGLGYGVLAST